MTGYRIGTQIRAGKPADIESIEVFEVFDHDVASAIQDGGCLVAEVDGRVAGYVAFARRGLNGKDFVKFLVVSPSHRRRGLALALLHAVEGELGRGRLFISTEADNTPMLALLERDGWVAAGQIEGINESGFAELFFYADLPRY